MPPPWGRALLPPGLHYGLCHTAIPASWRSRSLWAPHRAHASLHDQARSALPLAQAWPRQDYPCSLAMLLCMRDPWLLSHPQACSCQPSHTKSTSCSDFNYHLSCHGLQEALLDLPGPSVPTCAHYSPSSVPPSKISSSKAGTVICITHRHWQHLVHRRSGNVW